MLKKLRSDEDHKNVIEQGFTLVELLIVIVILGILAGIVVFAVGNLTSNAKTNACSTDIFTTGLPNGGFQRGQNLGGWREPEAARAAADCLLIDVGQIERPAAGLPGAGFQPVGARHGEGGARQGFQALVGGEEDGVDLGLRG